MNARLFFVLWAALCAACGESAPAPSRPAEPASPAGAAATSATQAPAAAAALPAPPVPASPAEVTGASPAASVPARLGLPDLRRICDGQVPGVPRQGAEPANVLWEAFASRDDRASLGRHFDNLFGAAVRLEQGDCDSWRFPPAKPTSLLQVCSPALDGPWTRCGAPPAGTASVLLVSELTGEPAP